MLGQHFFIKLTFVFVLSFKILFLGGATSAEVILHGIEKQSTESQEREDCRKGICKHGAHFGSQKQHQSFFSASFFLLPELSRWISFGRVSMENPHAGNTNTKANRLSPSLSDRAPPRLS